MIDKPIQGFFLAYIWQFLKNICLHGSKIKKTLLIKSDAKISLCVKSNTPIILIHPQRYLSDRTILFWFEILFQNGLKA